MPKFLTVADGKTVVASRLKLEAFTIFLLVKGGPLPVIKISVLFKFKLRKLELRYDRIDVKSVSLLK